MPSAFLRWTAVACAASALAACQPEFGSAETREDAIVGGARESGYPAVGGLVIELPGEDPSRSFCTGTLIDARWVLTAAHCVVGLSSRVPSRVEPSSTNYLHFYVGDDTTESSTTARTFAARAVHVHPGYADPGGERANDVALFELEDAVTGVDPLPIRRIPLGRVDYGKEVLYVGFGATQGNGQGSGVKRSIRSIIETVLSSIYITNQGGGGVCFGDSGGPGLMDDGRGIEVIGVNSTVFGSPTCETYSTQMRVAGHQTWIDRTMGTDLAGCSSNPNLCDCAGACQADGICDNSQCGLQTCGAIGNCLQLCTTQICYYSCLLNTTPEASYLYSELNLCASERCPSGSSSCLRENCRRELQGCSSGLAAVTGTVACSSIYRCQEGCGEDETCLDGCFYEGSLSAQAEHDTLLECGSTACGSLEGDARALCEGASCRDLYLGCMPDEACALTGGSCADGTACHPEAWSATYCLPHAGLGVGDSCALGARECSDGLVCVEGSCREMCATSADCERSFGPCTPMAAERIPFSVGVCSLSCPDADADGACDDVDCDPWDPNRHPGAEELCDALGVDEDCDGERNEDCYTEPPDAGVSDLGAPDAGTSDAGAAMIPTSTLDEEDEGCRCVDAGEPRGSFLLFGLLALGILFRRRTALGVLLALLVACGDDPEPLPAVDAGTLPVDAGTTDLGIDAGAASIDAGLPPAPDASTPPLPTISDVQQGLVAPGTSVSLEAVVTATLSEGFFISEPESKPYGGLFVATSDAYSGVVPGSVVSVLGTVEELELGSGSRTQLAVRSPVDWTVTGTRAVPAPLSVSLPELTLPVLAEPYESVRVALTDLTLTRVSTASPTVLLDNLVSVDTTRMGLVDDWDGVGSSFSSLRGILHYDARGFVLVPGAEDVVRAEPRLGGCNPVQGYLVCLARVPWADARIACRRRGGRLTVMETAEENLLVSAHVAMHSNRAFWVGASDIEEEGVFRWTSGSTVAFDAWGNGEPNNSNDEDCASSNYQRTTGRWNDANCNGNRPFSCEPRTSFPPCTVNADCSSGYCSAGSCVQ